MSNCSHDKFTKINFDELEFFFYEVWYLEDGLLIPSAEGNLKRSPFKSKTFSEEMIKYKRTGAILSKYYQQNVT